MLGRNFKYSIAGLAIALVTVIVFNLVYSLTLSLTSDKVFAFNLAVGSIILIVLGALLDLLVALLPKSSNVAQKLESEKVMKFRTVYPDDRNENTHNDTQEATQVDLKAEQLDQSTQELAIVK